MRGILAPRGAPQVNLGIAHFPVTRRAVEGGLILEELHLVLTKGTRDLVDIVRRPVSHILTWAALSHLSNPLGEFFR